jgi:hypothetical protein
MPKIIIAAVAAASLLTAASAANGGVICDVFGYCVYYPTYCPIYIISRSPSCVA